MTEHSVATESRCAKCKETKPASSFTRDKRNRSGLNSYCKQCIHDAKAWQTDYRKAYKKEYNDTHRKQNAASMKRWAESHPDKVKVISARSARNYKERHPENVKARTWKHTHKAEWKAALDYFDHRCAVCGRLPGLWHKLSSDHWIPLTDTRPDNPGNVVWNILPLCIGQDGCNNRKMNTDPHVWLTRTFSKKEVKAIEDRINTYFESVKPRKDSE